MNGTASSRRRPRHHTVATMQRKPWKTIILSVGFGFYLGVTTHMWGHLTDVLPSTIPVSSDSSQNALRQSRSTNEMKQPTTLDSNNKPHQLAILIPFRDSPDDTRSQGIGRTDNLRQFIDYMDTFLQHLPTRFVVIEQTQGGVFNKGLLFNAGYDTIKNDNDNTVDYLVLHDVDQIPIHPKNTYHFKDIPTKLIHETTRKTSHNGTDQVRHLSTLNVGGAFQISTQNYVSVNGYSNRFGGWGLEDDNMAYRVKTILGNYNVLDKSVGQYRELYHDRVWGLDENQQFKNNSVLGTELESGLSDLKYKLVQRSTSPFLPNSKNHLVDRLLIEPLVDYSNQPYVPHPDRVAALATRHKKKQQPPRKRYPCDALFGKDAVQPSKTNARCVTHAKLHWVSCRLGDVVLDFNRIEGSVGNETVSDVLGRPEEKEQFRYSDGAMIVSQPVPNEMRPDTSFLYVNHTIVDEQQLESVSSDNGVDVTFLVSRGDYANPCWVFAIVYNVYVAVEAFGETDHTKEIVWLDGHAMGELDSVWKVLFGSRVSHAKLLGKSAEQKSVKLHNAIAVNVGGAFNDQAMRMYQWGTKCDPEQSALHQFRDFVLEKFGVSRKGPPSATDERPLLTFMVRRNYQFHPRSDGIADRTLANETLAVENIKALYPDHDVEVVAFEGLAFRDQLVQIAKTDLLVTVHGAGNVHVLFLPNHASIVEYFPKNYGRFRFAYLSTCLGLDYRLRMAETVKKLPKKKGVIVQITRDTKYKCCFEKTPTLSKTGFKEE